MENIISMNWDIFMKLGVAMILGMVIGAERVAHGQTAGMRTYAMVAMGAALFVLISEAVAMQFLNVLNFDPLRMAAQIIVGVGFLGAGMIIFKENQLIGLTTASGLWVSAGIGMASGFGLFNLAIIATALTLFIFSALFIFEERFRKIAQKENNKASK